MAHAPYGKCDARFRLKRRALLAALGATSLGGFVPRLGIAQAAAPIKRLVLVFQPNGGNAGSNATFTLCDGRGAARAATLVLANDGRLRGGTPTALAAQACLVAMD